MTSADCALCGSQITALNDSEEHVIANALGGRLKVRSFLCAPCNSSTGHRWDAELASQLQVLCLLVGGDRERGQTSPLVVTTTTGQALRITPDQGLSLAHPSYKAEKTENGLRISFVARTMAEARQRLRELKAKYPTIDLEAAEAQVRSSWAWPEGLMNHSFQIGGPAASRALVKSVAAFAFHSGLPANAFADAIAYLRRAEEPPPLGWYYATDPLGGRLEGTPVTCVGVHANPRTGMVLGYAEYFGIHRAVVALGDGYTGAEVRAVHGFDPRTGAVLPVTIDLPFDADELQAIFRYERIPAGVIEGACEPILLGALRRQAEAEPRRVIGEAFDHALATCGLAPDQEISAEAVHQIAALATDYLTPWLLHHLSRGRPLGRPPAPAMRADPDGLGRTD